VARGVRLAQRVIDQIDQVIGTDRSADNEPMDSGLVLHAIKRILPSGKPESISLPLTPLGGHRANFAWSADGIAPCRDHRGRRAPTPIGF